MLIFTFKLNKLQRYFFLKLEIKFVLLKFLDILKKSFDRIIILKVRGALSEYSNNAHKSKIASVCILTGRFGSVYRYFRISRIMLRKVGGSNLIYGLRKSSW
jgi:ribosomal protein S14